MSFCPEKWVMELSGDTILATVAEQSQGVNKGKRLNCSLFWMWVKLYESVFL